MSDEEVAHIEDVWTAFLKKHTKKELFEEALKRHFDLTPVQNSKDLLEDEQLESREFWVPVEHEDVGKIFQYPGAPFKTSADIWSIKGRAPHLGEHNELIYGGMGYTKEELVNLRTEGVI